MSDFDPMERRAQHSLNSAVLHLRHADTRIHLIDGTQAEYVLVPDAQANLSLVQRGVSLSETRVSTQE